MKEPEWQHGYRCHGYWIGVVQWGRVSIEARRFGLVAKKNGYEWQFTPNGIVGQRPASGKVDTLRQGKREVERMYREWTTANTA